MKWIGALLLLGTTTWVGFEWNQQLVNRPKHIRQLKHALQILEAEMLYSQLPLADAFATIAIRIPRPTKHFFERLTNHLSDHQMDLVAAWEKALKEYKKESSVGTNEIEILNQFGRTLGQHDFLQQQKHIHLTISHLDRELEDAKDNQHRYGKMAKSLGFLLGLFIVLLLI